MDQNQQLLLHTQEENKQLLAITHKDSSNDDKPVVNNGEYEESKTDQKPETDTENQVSEKTEKKRHWWNLFG